MIDPLTMATSVAGLLSLTIQVSQMLNEHVRTLKNAPNDAQELLDELELLRQVLAGLKAFLDAQDVKGNAFKETSVLINAIKGFKAKITDLKLKLEKLTKKQGFAQLIERGKWCYEHDEHQEIITTLHRYLGMFQMSLSIGGIDLLSKSIDDVARGISGLKSAISASTPNPREAQKKSEQLDDILQLLSPLSSVSIDVSGVSGTLQRWDKKWQDQESQEIVAWLSPLNFWAKQDDTLSRKHEGTGQWLFEHPAFKRWLDGTDRILWCPGMPGAGKTVLTSAVIDYLGRTFREEDVGIAFIYCSYKEQMDQNLTNLVASLLQQLVQRHSVIPNKVRSLYEQHISKRTRPTLAECYELLRSELTSCSRAFIVVDALDECNETNGTRSRLIAELLSLPPTAYLLVTSRHVLSIEDTLNQSSRLEIRASDTDVRIYLENRIQEKSRLKRHVQADPSLRNPIIDTIVEKVQGMFLLAQLHMESLAKKQNRKAVRIALESLPKGLDDTYDQAMERICNQDEDDARLAKKVLSWISYAFRPLTVKEIQHALAVEPNEKKLDEEALPDKELLVSVCAGIVTIDQESNIIRLVHYTTEEYFERNRLNIFPDGQAHIAMTCLTYLSFDAFADGYCSSDEQMDTRLKENPLLHYAAQHWGHHAIGGPERTIMSQILEFLAQGSRLSCFVQAMHLSEYRYPGYSQRTPKAVPGLWAAAVFGLREIVGLLVEQKADVEAKSTDGETALHGAAGSGHEAVVRLLLEKGANVAAEDNGGRTALHKAAEGGHEAVVRLLLEKGADVGAETKYKGTALHWAADKGHEAVVRLLVEKGADVAAKDNGGGTPLHRAAGSGHEMVVRLLLEKRADIDTGTNYGWTALHWAAERGHEAVVRLLLEKGANIVAETNYGETALHRAAGSGHEAVVRLLLESGADIVAETNYGVTALHRAAVNGHEAVMQLLLQKGTDIDTGTNNGWTALHWAADRGHEAVMRLLLEKWADIVAETNYGETALHRAAGSGHEAVVQLLLEKGTEIDTGTNYGWTALHLAAERGHEAVVRLLLEKWADIVTETNYGETALHWAAERGHEVVVRLLLEKGADAAAEDKAGETALRRAAKSGHEVVVQLLTPLTPDS